MSTISDQIQGGIETFSPFLFVILIICCNKVNVICKINSSSMHMYIYVPRCLIVSQIKLPIDLGDDLFYGRAGYLWACSFLNKHLGRGTISISQMVNKYSTSSRKSPTTSPLCSV